MNTMPVGDDVGRAGILSTPPHAAALEAKLLANWPAIEWRDSHVVLAVSGGADSTALLWAVHRLKTLCGGAGRLFVAHLNHGLRGNESDADAAWLAALCAELEMPLELERADVAKIAAAQGDGWEMAARTARSEFLQRTAERLGARFVVTAHTADDQIETLLQRIVRGTGLAGLAGIPAVRRLSASVSIVRPLLNVRRAEILEYLNDLRQDFRNDSSNSDRRFTRNRVRNELLPLLRERFNEDVDSAILRLAEQAGAVKQLLEAMAEEIAGKCVKFEFRTVAAATNRPIAGTNGEESNQARCVCFTVDCSALASEPKVMLCEMFRCAWRRANWGEQSMGHDEWRLLASMAAGEFGRTASNLPGNIIARRSGHTLTCEHLGLP